MWALLLFCTLALGLKAQCNEADRVIYGKLGSTFATLFRSYAGWTVSKAAYEERIVKEVKLSPACAACYGDAYSKKFP